MIAYFTGPYKAGDSPPPPGWVYVRTAPVRHAGQAHLVSVWKKELAPGELIPQTPFVPRGLR